MLSLLALRYGPQHAAAAGAKVLFLVLAALGLGARDDVFVEKRFGVVGSHGLLCELCHLEFAFTPALSAKCGDETGELREKTKYNLMRGAGIHLAVAAVACTNYFRSALDAEGDASTHARAAE